MDVEHIGRFEIAGVPFEVHCRFERNLEFLQKYRTYKKPSFIISPSLDDMDKVLGSIDFMAEFEGRKKWKVEDLFLENNAILILLSEMLSTYQVLLIHGSALCIDGNAYIFTGPSGIGKSTHARLWRKVFGEKVCMINDDKPMLRIEDDKVVVYGTPWDGKHNLSNNTSAPLKAIVQLVRATENHIERLGKADAYPVVLNQCFCSNNPKYVASTLYLESALLDKTLFYKLSCNMESDAAVICRQAIDSGYSPS